MLEKNVVYEAVITDYTAEGQGIAHIEGITVFIPNAIAGERVRVRIEAVRKTWAAGKITELLEKSPHRVNRQCPVAKLCGGCDFWHMDYEEETRLKADRVKTCLNRLAGEHFEEIPILAAPALCGYRNKAQYPVASKKGRVYAGFFRAGTHEVVENSRCLILPEETDRVKDAVIDYANQYRVSAYDEAAHTGLLRHIYVRRGAVSGQVLVCLVANGRKLPHVPELVARLQKIPGFTTLVQNINTRHTNVIMGPKNKVIWGPGVIHDRLGKFTFAISPHSFFQVNTLQAEKLYETALQYASLTGKEKVIDAYCGTGTITLFLAQKAQRALGIEIVAPAIRDARQNARDNHVANVDFLCGDAAKEMPELVRQGSRPDVVVLDPPRAGCEQRVLDAIARVRPQRVVYVSCNPASLARDAAILRDKGFVVRKVQPVDMFPHTSHVETVCLLTLR